MRSKNKDLFILHLVIFLWGFTGVLGAIISTTTDRIMWYRALLAATTLYIYARYKKINLKIDKKGLQSILLNAVIFTIFWFCFYEAIKVSSVSVTLVVYSSGSFFMAFLEPLFYKKRINPIEVVLGILILGVLIYIFKLETQYVKGIILSLLAAITFGLFTLLNSKLITNYNSTAISFYEISITFILTSIYFLVCGKLNGEFLHITSIDLFWIAILAVFATTLTMVLTANVLKTISPYTVMLTLNLETIYGIVAAYFILDESKYLTKEFYIGTAIITLIILYNAWLKKMVTSSGDGGAVSRSAIE